MPLKVKYSCIDTSQFTQAPYQTIRLYSILVTLIFSMSGQPNPVRIQNDYQSDGEFIVLNPAIPYWPYVFCFGLVAMNGNLNLKMYIHGID